MKHGCLIWNCNIPPYAMNWFDFGIELSLSVVCVCHLICGVNIWIFRGIWPHWKCDAFNLNRFSQSSRCVRMCGYLYGKFDCWLILNSQNTIYCHYQKSYLTWGPQYGSKAGDVTANQKHIIFCGVTKENNCERQTDVMNLWSCCCWCVIH